MTATPKLNHDGGRTEGRRTSTTERATGTHRPGREAAQRCFILGYDRTDSSRGAAMWAVEALLPDGKLVIVHACRPLHAPAWPISSPAERRVFGRALIDELLLEGEDSMFDIDIEAELSDHDPVNALVEAARSHGARAIVIGHEQHSRLHDVLGTVTSQLLKASPVPVIVAPLAVTTTSAQTGAPRT